jgi:hypothetical protein
MENICGHLLSTQIFRYGYASHGGDRQTIEVMTSKCYSYALLKISLMVSYENELKYFK